MIGKIAAAAVFAAAMLTGSAVASAQQGFNATPMNSGPPRDLLGESVLPGAREGLGAFNAITAPILQPVLAPGGGAEPVGAEPMMRHRHHRHHRRFAHMRHHMS